MARDEGDSKRNGEAADSTAERATPGLQGSDAAPAATTPGLEGPEPRAASRAAPADPKAAKAGGGRAGPPVPGEGDLEERLDGMRGWLGDLDRTVSVRSRIGLVLAAIAIGGAGAAIYLSLNAKEQSASDGDVGELRQQVDGVQEDVDGIAQDIDALRSSVEAARSQASGANATASDLQRRLRRLRGDVKDLQQSASDAAAAPQAGAVPGAGTVTPTTPGAGSGAGADTDSGTGSGGGGTGAGGGGTGAGDTGN